MSVLRRILLHISGFFLRSTLFFGFTLLAATIVLGSKESIKETLLSVNAYERFTQSIIDTGAENAQKDNSSIPFNDPGVVAVIRQSFGPDQFEKITETVIDSSYSWLNGDSDKLQFDINLAENKETLARGLAGYATDRISQLPPCTTIPTETNIFKIECRPEYLDLGQQKELIYQTIVNDTSFLSDASFSNEDLPKDSKGQSFEVAYAKAPTYYVYFRWSPYIILASCLVAAIGVIFLSKKRRDGIKYVASSLISTAVFLSITPIIYTYVLPALGFKLPTFSGGGSQTFSAIVNDFTSALYTNFNVMLINVAIQVGATGIIIYIATKFFKSKAATYVDLEKRSGLAPAIEKNPKTQPKKFQSKSLPVQTSEGARTVVRKPSAINKKLRKM